MAQPLATLLLTRVHRPTPQTAVHDLPLTADDIMRRLARLCSEEAVSDYTRQWAAGWIGGFATGDAAS